ncbi:modifier of mdg4-like isoform X8 [Toxorhynchites rutilus septentrionalis]|uniref:modifier of mdg4-like isoform X8 n=1 Tax=Toxorhynchites rutilus septentrionalis TaxID=329112 RepID=UPI002479A016|nr:modifier of mdg4-like isoform X8 [Toxorhynchites rutilus septentrionalis]
MADDEQFSLCWNNFNTNLSAGFHESLIQGDLVDVTLAAEGQLVKAHRLILSVCSPYFRKMFTQMPANQHAFIFLKDVSHSALKDLIQFMYCGEVNVKQDALPAFISTAEALQIKGLTETGESAPAQQSPAKDTSHHLPSSGVTTIPSSASSPRAKPVQRSRIQSYKIDSDNESEHEKVVQIQATSTSTNASSSSTGPSATIVATQVSTAPQQVQIIQQQQQAQKRTLQQRASITPQTTQIMKRAKLSDPLEAPEPAQIQTVQIVKQITQTPQPTISSEPEYVEMPIETINPKAEPDYVDDPSEVEAIETEHEHEHEHEQALTEHEAAEHEQDADDNYVEDETYGEMAKYDESYFTEGEEVKAGASGFGSESYTDCGTAADQAAQGTELDSEVGLESIAIFTTTMRGKEQLLYLGQPFVFEKLVITSTAQSKKIWRCNQWWNQKCRARVYTIGNLITPLNRYHTHSDIVKRKRRVTKKKVVPSMNNSSGSGGAGSGSIMNDEEASKYVVKYVSASVNYSDQKKLELTDY